MPTQREITRDFYLANPNRDIPHAEAVDWIERTYREQTGEKFRDPDRMIRLLHQEGFLQKISKGVYRYDPELATVAEQEDFTPAQIAEIMRIGNYKCAVCGLGRKDGIELHADHIRPKARGGKAAVSNGQVLCAAHNFKKRNYSQTETAKQLFINLHNQAEAIGDENLMDFAKSVLAIYEEHGVNGHIIWRPDDDM